MDKKAQKRMEIGMKTRMFRFQLNQIRKHFGSKIKSLIPHKDIKNNLSLRLALANNFYYFSIPENLVMNQADWGRMQELIQKELEDVSKRD